MADGLVPICRQFRVPRIGKIGPSAGLWGQGRSGVLGPSAHRQNRPIGRVMTPVREEVQAEPILPICRQFRVPRGYPGRQNRQIGPSAGLLGQAGSWPIAYGSLGHRQIGKIGPSAGLWGQEGTHGSWGHWQYTDTVMGHGSCMG